MIFPRRATVPLDQALQGALGGQGQAKGLVLALLLPRPPALGC